MALKVIGAGFGRTGTDSMREALNILGFGPCHHMFEINDHPEQVRTWRAFAAGAAPDWEALYAGYTSAVDWPTAHFWRELMEVFPQAKVLLTWRTPESWLASAQNSIMRMLDKLDPDSVGRKIVYEQAFGGNMSPENALRLYRANVDAVLAEVPPGRLTLHRIGDGWGPLCAGLGVAVPEVPFPSRNSTSAFHTKMGLGQAS